MERTLAVIPARGGSTELRRKNLLDVDGIPMFIRSAAAARAAGCDVIVSTDDVEIASIARAEGYRLHRRGPELADVPVDEVVQRVVDDVEWDGPVLLVQPTVQPMTTELLGWFLHQVGSSDWSWARPTALGVEDRHITWFSDRIETEPRCLTGRVERQVDAYWPIREVGVRWWPSSRVSSPQGVIAAPSPLVDVDDAGDYRRLDRRLTIQFYTVASRDLGWGHLRRVLTLAEGLQHHDVEISLFVWDRDALAFLEERGWPPTPSDHADVVVWDSLDERMPLRMGTPSVALETTRRDATVTVNALYGHGDYAGSRYAVLRPEFLLGDGYQVRPDGRRVMLLFGGTDPSGLTDLAEQALTKFDLDVIRPEEGRDIADAMRQADLLVTSGGRTVYEAAAVGVPTIVMCQNQRELTHTHLGVGNLNLGLGRLVHPDKLLYVVGSLLDDPDLRMDLHRTARASLDYQGAARVRRIIEHVGLFGEKP